MNKINFFSEYLTAGYGAVLHRIAIDLPLSCPNRLNGGHGCIYCAEDGNRARHLRHHFSLPDQVAAGREYIRRRYNNEGPYIAYFQSYTNTFAPVAQLRAWYEEVLALADFKMIIVATRPDCLPDDVLELLSELSQRYELWVELGVQTSNDATLERINRGHDFASVRQAVASLAERGIRAAAHVILGLPGEGPEDFRQTAEDLAALPFQAIKLHQLMILRKTPLASGKYPVKPLNEYEYAAAAVDFLRRLPDDWIVMRLMADADNDAVIAPKWWMKKGQFLEYAVNLMNGGDAMRVRTADGSPTLYHPGYRQHFHTVAGAETEAREKFAIPSGLAERPLPRLLDIGFGLGYNAAAALTANPDAEIITLENDPRTLAAARELFPPDTLQYRMIDGLARHGRWNNVTLMDGDARDSVRRLAAASFDAVFMDGFSPDVNPELWTYDFIRELRRLLKPEGIIVTYSSAYPLRGAFLRLGFRVYETAAFGRKRGGTAAVLHGSGALPEKEQNIILRSTAGVPYRDPGLKSTPEQILQRRERLVKRLRARGVPKWFKG
jgi:hypothetical protein